APGTQTADEPTIGTSENTAVTIPHKTGEVNPSTQKPSAVRTPCAAPTSSMPYTLATIELLIPVNSRSTWLRVRGRTSATRSFVVAPSRKRKNNVKNAITAVAMKETKLPTTCAPQENKYWLTR